MSYNDDHHNLPSYAYLGGLLLKSIGKADSVEQGRDMILATLKDGTALTRFEKMLINQNVKPDVAHQLCRGDCEQVLGKAQYITPLLAPSSGIPWRERERGKITECMSNLCARCRD